MSLDTRHCGTRCRAANRWHRVADYEAAVHHAAGFAEGFLAGFQAALTPSDGGLPEYREARVARRVAEMEATLARRAAPPEFWPDEMKGGWPMPPGVPDPEDLWPEHDGWPVPPPALR